ncbi:DUF3472 domain-containing protein [Sphingobacterium haloxyli]|uniref:Nematoblast specific protein n=1 Tax=Sphingobacterium haloxyli TaxID=2100533 RepID=A0A2S9J3D0_9SPHI|nr:DUF3472 domain-containing protein [Sphingobacterium haloxyli]PRD47269.1 nematoblast specific protein [Sphingobacterium haloxyli]
MQIIRTIKTFTLLSLCVVLLSFCSKTKEDAINDKVELADSTLFEVPLAGNAFLTNKPERATEMITANGLANWTNAETISSVYFRVGQAGRLYMKLRAKVAPAENSSTVRVSVNDVSKKVTLSSADYETYHVGYFDVDSGYVKVDLQGLTKTGEYFADLSHILVGGESTTAILYANDPDYYYWARRGPSCHMAYTIPTTDPVEYYYGELTVPTGEDAIGSYFMSNGFSEGYFGIQVNSATERRVLFSVWSPYNTDNPEEIPPHLRIGLNKKGDGVYTGEFGNEGSGGQSYLKYNWKAGEPYKFLLKGQPDNAGSTDFTAWIYLEDRGGWNLIASWKRPEISKYLTGFHSFLENFNPDNGHLGRRVLFANRWVRTAAGNWLPIQSAKFTVDATYKAQQRIDAIGGVENDHFYLQNGAFFSEVVAPNSSFSINPPKEAPDIDFDSLP